MFDPIHKIDEGLFLGNETAAKNENLLKEFDIEAICICGYELSIQKYKDLKPEIRVYKIFDTPTANIGKYFEMNCAFIDEMRQMNKNVFVHCAAGVSRSASFVIAYMMKTYNMGFEDAYIRVKQKRKCVKPNHGFIEQLKKFEEINKSEKEV